MSTEAIENSVGADHPKKDERVPIVFKLPPELKRALTKRVWERKSTIQDLMVEYFIVAFEKDTGKKITDYL